ncbi:MSMEG_0565 family glycosyltransferase [Roseiarcaceae bacterium H3SJ34-1]|uniref:MSMEG_0565 family glycosyltransferase n=1 Tax=Terripilifer ovatus TaxID=3032367 RepID=UPI003AB97957|nr:MSMEG_0565 family glycosyltransferase [Roseiarcaceae bacterium H3SJ34-1]
MLAHSTNPRGGVVHALMVAETLTALGEEVVVHAPDETARGFFRPTQCKAVSVPASPVHGDTHALVERRIADYLAYFDNARHRRLDIWHAQDGISGNALAILKQRGLIDGYAMTVHHIDRFEDDRLNLLQARAMREADCLLVVSQRWRDVLRSQFDREPVIVGNGVDRQRFRPVTDGRETVLRAQLGLGAGPVVLAIGGIERRKNTVRMLQGFAQLRKVHPTAQLVVAGGISLLDHSRYQIAFNGALAETGLPPNAVILPGVIADDEMPALYRVADVLVFASIEEGFGLVVVEAMASGTPVVVSKIAPFTDYLGEYEAVWCDPERSGSIADAMVMALTRPLRGRLIARGFNVALRHDWIDTAKAHLPVYESLKMVHHA